MRNLTLWATICLLMITVVLLYKRMIQQQPSETSSAESSVSAQFITRDQLREEFEQFRDEVIAQRIIPLEDKTDLFMTRYNHAHDAV